MTSVAVFVLIAIATDGGGGDDSTSLMKLIPMGLGKAIHEMLVARQVLYILQNENAFISDLDTTINSLEAELGIDFLGFFIPLGSKPGFQLPVADISNAIDFIVNLFNFSILGIQLDNILDLDIKVPLTSKGTNYMYFWDGDSMEQGISFTPDRYLKVRDVYNWVIIKRILMLFKRFSFLGGAAAATLSSALVKGFSSKTRVDDIQTSLAVLNGKVDVIDGIVDGITTNLGTPSVNLSVDLAAVNADLAADIATVSSLVSGIDDELILSRLTEILSRIGLKLAF